MDGAQRDAGLAVQRGDLADDMLDECEAGLQARIDHVVVVQLRRLVDGAVVEVVEQVFRRVPFAGGLEPMVARLHGLHRRAGMARHFDLGDHVDMARGGVAQDLDVIGAGVVAGTGRVVRIAAGAVGRLQADTRLGAVAAHRADGSELRQAGDLQPPAFVVGEMEMEGIELVARHQVEQLEHSLFCVEVAADVQLEAAIRKTRRADDGQLGQIDAAGTRQRHQVPQRLQAVGHAGGAVADNGDAAVGLDGQAVCFRRGLAGNHADAQAQFRYATGCGRYGGCGREQGARESGLRFQRSRRDYPGRRRQMQPAEALLQPQRRRKQRRQRLRRQQIGVVITAVGIPRRDDGFGAATALIKLFRTFDGEQFVVRDVLPHLGRAVVDNIRAARRFRQLDDQVGMNV